MDPVQYYKILDSLSDANRANQNIQRMPSASNDPGLGMVSDIMNAPVLGGGVQGLLHVLGAIGHAPVVGGALNAAQEPGALIRSIIFGNQFGGRANAPGPLGTIQSTGMGLEDLLNSIGKYGLGGGLQHQIDTYNDIPTSGGKLLADMVVDPLNLLTGGKVAGMVGKLPIPKSEAVAEMATAYPKAVRETIAKGGTLTKEQLTKGLDKLEVLNKKYGNHIHPGFFDLLEQSPRAKVALENDKVMGLLGHLANAIGQPNSARLLADYFSAHPQVADAARNQMKQYAEDLIMRAGHAGTPNLSPDEAASFIFRHVPNLDLQHAEQLGNKLPAIFEKYDKDMQYVRDLQNTIGSNHDNLEHLTDYVRQLAETGDPTAKTALGELKDIRNNWLGTDPLREPEDFVVSGRYLRNFAAENGLTELHGLEKGWRELLTAWRQQALFAPAYWINNTAQAVAQNKLFTGSVGMNDLPHAMGGVTGKFLEDATGELQKLLDEHPNLAQYAGPIQKSLTTIRQMPRYQQLVQMQHEFGPWVQQHAIDYELDPKSIPEVLQAGTSSQIGGLKSRVERPLVGFERVPGLGRLFQYMREGSEAVESTGRLAAFINTYKKSMAGSMEDLTKVLEPVLREDGLSPADIDDLLMKIKSTKGAIGPQKLAGWIIDAGGDEHSVVKNVNYLNELRGQAHTAAVNEAQHIHLDYRKTTNLDEILRNVTGFHFWATRMIPMYLEIMATHPGLLNAIDRMEQDSTNYRNEHDMSSPRLQSTVPMFGPGRQLAHMLFGRDGEIFVDPTRLTAFTDRPFDVFSPAKGESPVGRVLDALNSVGVSPNPALQIPLQMSGAYGARQPSDILRLTSLINGLVREKTGRMFDLELPLHAIARERPLNALGADQPLPAEPNDMVRWRLRELSQEKTGTPNAPEYKLAEKEGSKNPLWREAVMSLGNQQTRERVMSLMGMPTRFYSDAQHELDIKKAEKQRNT